MRTKLYICMYALLQVIALTSCESDEELTPSGANDNFFAVRADDKSDDAALRRDFYEKNGMYLLFTDTLRHEYVGKDITGEDAYFNELIDFNYNLNTVGISEFKITYLKTLAEKKTAVDFVEKYIVPHFKGGSLAPYSFFLADNLSEYEYDYSWYQYMWNDKTFLSCMRCIGLSLGKIGNMCEADKEEYAKNITKNILATRLTYDDDRLNEFYEPVNQYMREFVSDIDPTYDGTDPDIAYKYGFLVLDSYLDWNTWEYVDMFPQQDVDFKEYFNLVMSSTPEEVEAKYKKFPTVVYRYNYLRDLISSLGYKF